MFVRIIIFTKMDCISPYSFRMRENVDQNNSEYGHPLPSDCVLFKDDKMTQLSSFSMKSIAL